MKTWASRLFLALALSLGTSEAARAQTQPPGYRDVVDLALAEYGDRNFEEARAQFRRAHALFPNARTLRGIGMTEYELRNYGECIQALEEALRSDVRPLEGRLRAETETLLAKARNYVARVNLDLQPGAATVIVDGVPVTLGQGNTLVLRVGDHVLEFKAEGRTPERRELRVNGGEQQSLRVVLNEQAAAPTGSAITPNPPIASAPNPARPSASGAQTEPSAARITTERRVTETRISAPTPMPAPHEATTQSASPVPWIIAGVSGAVLITGIVLIAIANSQIAKVEDARDGTRWSELEAAYDNSPIMSGIGVSLIGVGAAGAVTGVVLALTPDDTEAHGATQVAVGLGNLSIKGTF